MKLLLTIVACFFYCQYSNAGMGSCKATDPLAITLSVTIINATCQKDNGKIIVQASGGVAPYSFLRSGSTIPEPLGAFWGLPPANYTITVTDAIGQVATQNVTIINLYPLPKATVISVSSPSSCTARDATLTLQGSNGLPPYTYSLDDANFQVSNTFTNLTGGYYQYEVKDANGCTSSGVFLTSLQFQKIVNQNCSIDVNGLGISANCSPAFYMSWTLNQITGGTPPYIYSMDGINYQTSPTFNYLPKGVNTFWIKDAAGLVFLYSTSYIPDCNVPFLVNTIVQPANCGQNGTITVTASAGAAPYEYSVDGITFQSSNQFTGLAPGNYIVTVKDSLNLTSTILTVIPNNCVAVTANISSSTCSNSNGKITAQASNGTAPYQYSLDGINYAANNVFANLLAGNYTLYTKDATGNVGIANVIISNIPGPQIVSIDTTATGCDNRSGIINIAATNGTAPLLYSLNGAIYQSSPVFTGIAQGVYTVTVKDANDCIVTKPAIVTMGVMPPIVNLGNDATLCEGNTLLLDATNLNATYQWQDNSTSSTYLVTSAGKYFVTVSKQGCLAKDTINISYDLKPKFSLGVDSRLCLGSKITLDPQITGVSYLWQDGSTNQTYLVTQPGLYTLTATNNCGAITDDILISNGVCNLYVPNSFTPNGDTKNDLFKVSYGDNVTDFQLQVFNRYGQIVFTTKDKNKGWGGNFLGSQEPFGAYAWIIQYKTTVNNSLQKLQGTVLLIR